MEHTTAHEIHAGAPDGNEPDLDDAQVQRLLSGAVRERIGISSEGLSLGLDMARGALQRGAMDDAYRLYCALVLCEPLNVDFQVGFANCLLAVEQYLVASQAASLAICLAPADPRGYYLSGRAYLGLGLVADALDDLNEAVTRGQAARDPMVVEEARKLLAAVAARPAETERAAVAV